MDEIKLLLQQIEREVNNGKKSVLNGGVIVNKKTILDLTNRIATLLTAFGGEHELAKARQESQDMLNATERKCNEMIENCAVVNAASKRAAKICDDANAYQDKIFEDVNKSVNDAFDLLEKDVKYISDWLQKSREQVQINSKPKND